MVENQNIEFKSSWHDDYLKWICGFANAHGGTIFIGKDDSGKLVGLSDARKLLEEIPNKIRDHLGLVCSVELNEELEKKYISITVNPYSVPVSLRGRYYYRSGSTKMELTGIELNEFLLKKTGKTWDDVVEERATLEDIDKNSVAKFIEDARDLGRMPDTAGLTTFQVLEKLQLTEGRKLKRAAIVLFGKEPSRFYPNILIKIGRFGMDSTDLKFQEVVGGNLIKILAEVQVQLNYKFLTKPIEFIGFQRIEKDEYPVAALREMILNTIVHRTYMGAHIQLRVYDNKISIWNEGLLPYGLTVMDLKEEHNSRPRNPKIAKACFMAGYIDTWGRGMLRIFNSCTEHGLPEPDIKEKDGGFMVTLFKSSHNNSNDEAIGGTIGGTIGSTIENNQTELTDRQLEILMMIKQDNLISIRRIAEKLNINISATQNHIEKLKEKNIIERVGGTRGYWKILFKL